MKCPDCKKQMSLSEKCDFPWIKVNGEWYVRDTEYFDSNSRCHDCNIENKKGNIHHFGCDVERCPKCDGQLISCNCSKEGIGKPVS